MAGFPGEPAVVIVDHLELLDKERPGAADGVPLAPHRHRAALSPVGVVLPQHLEGGIGRVVVAVDDPYGRLHRERLVDVDLLDMAVRPLPDEAVADVVGSIIPRIEGNDRQHIAFPVFEIGPVDLCIRILQGPEIGIGVHRLLPRSPGPRRALPDRLLQQVPHRHGIAPDRGFGLQLVLPDARSRGGEKIPERIFLIITVVGRGQHRLVDLLHLLRPERHLGKQLRQLVEGDAGRLAALSGIREIFDFVVQLLAAGAQQRRNHQPHCP